MQDESHHSFPLNPEVSSSTADLPTLLSSLATTLQKGKDKSTEYGHYQLHYHCCCSRKALVVAQPL